MDKNTVKFVVLFAALIGGGYYYFTTTKNYYATIILKTGNYGRGIDELLTFDKKFLKAWAKAAKEKKASFVFDAKNFSTKGGSTIK